MGIDVEVFFWEKAWNVPSKVVDDEAKIRAGVIGIFNSGGVVVREASVGRAASMELRVAFLAYKSVAVIALLYAVFANCDVAILTTEVACITASRSTGIASVRDAEWMVVAFRALMVGPFDMAWFLDRRLKFGRR